MADEREQWTQEELNDPLIIAVCAQAGLIKRLKADLAAAREEIEELKRMLRYEREIHWGINCGKLRTEVRRYFQVPFEDDIAEQFPLMAELARESDGG